MPKLAMQAAFKQLRFATWALAMLLVCGAQKPKKPERFVVGLLDLIETTLHARRQVAASCLGGHANLDRDVRLAPYGDEIDKARAAPPCKRARGCFRYRNG